MNVYIPIAISLVSLLLAIYSFVSKNSKENTTELTTVIVKLENIGNRELCKFTEDELEYFELRSKKKSNVQIALTMHVSEAQVSKLARKVKNKIIRMI